MLCSCFTFLKFSPINSFSHFYLPISPFFPVPLLPRPISFPVPLLLPLSALSLTSSHPFPYAPLSPSLPSPSSSQRIPCTSSSVWHPSVTKACVDIYNSQPVSLFHGSQGCSRGENGVCGWGGEENGKEILIINSVRLIIIITISVGSLLTG